MFKVIIIVLGIAVIVGLGIIIDSDSRQKPDSSPPAIDFSSAPIHASGRVEGVTEEIELRPELHGRVIEVLVHEADHVEQGDPLIRLDGAQQEFKCASAEADLDTAKAELERLVSGARQEERREASAEVAAFSAQLAGVRQRHERMATLRGKGSVTEQELDDLDAELKRLSAQLDAARARHELLEAPAREDELRRGRARVAAAEAALSLARHECEKTTLRAPCAAQVLKIGAELGELVGPNDAEPATIVADTSRLFVRAYVDELDAPRVQIGMPARVTVDGLPAAQVSGHVVRLAPRMSRKPLRTDDPAERFDTKVREVWIELAGLGSENLVVGLPVDVVLEVSSHAEAAATATLPDGS